jgi:hypothetical protein
MTRRAAIFGSLVDIRNVGAHKSVRLTVEVPAELAAAVIDTFGWPTHAEPVPVALARMAEVPKGDPAPTAKSYAAEAAVLCKDRRFQLFIEAVDYDSAAVAVRERCAIKSRAELIAGSPPGELWRKLVEEFNGWLAAERAGAS